ncbi:MAG: biotin--[acetyl-CoA-carboxylase] ligase [Acidimicrobiales bacterium]
MDVDAVRRELEGTRFADVVWSAETGSTNDDLMAAARDGAADGTVHVAGHQRAGRGRLDRRWEAPPGSSLLCSVLLRPASPAIDWHLLATAAGVAASQAVEATCGVRPSLKWPNDLVVIDAAGTRKLAGVLAESAGAGKDDPVLVIGMGCNVAWPAELPEELASIATALNHLTPDAPTVDDLLVAYLRALDGWCVRLDVAAPDERDAAAAMLADSYAERSATLGRSVRVDTGGVPVEGTAVRVERSGHLVVDTAAGTVEVAVGDVLHLRHEPEDRR